MTREADPAHGGVDPAHGGVDLARIGKPVRTLFGFLLFRRVSRPLSIALARAGVSPTAVTFAGLGTGLAGAAVLSSGRRAPMIAGAVLVMLAKVLDASDGEVARLRHLDTARGYVVDGLCDRLRDTAVLFGCAAAARAEPGAPVWALGALGVYLGFFYVSAAAPSHWREAASERDVNEKHAFRVTRSLRLGAGDTLAVALLGAAVIARPLWLLVAVTVLGLPAIAYKTRVTLASRPWEHWEALG